MLVTRLIADPRLLGAVDFHTAILGVRAAQGAIAWAILLNAFPYVAVPPYSGRTSRLCGAAPRQQRLTDRTEGGDRA
jgi:hypothetical protein